MKKRKVSPVVQQYRKERRRIQNQMRRMSKRGYEFTKDILPPIPKKITAGSVRRLKKITTQSLYESSEYVDYSTGEVLTGRQYRQRERHFSAMRGVATRIYKKLHPDEEQRTPEPPSAPPEEDDYRVDYIQAYEWLKSELEEISSRYPASKQSLDYIIDTAYSQLAEYYQRVNSDINDNRREFGLSPVSFDIDRLVRKAIGQNIVNSSEEVREAIQAIDESAYNVQGKRFHGACVTLTRVLLNRPMSAEENRALTEAQEQDTDFATYD